MRLHTEDYDREPHDLCKKIPLSEIATTNLADFERYLGNNNISVDKIIAATLVLNLAVTYMPPMTPGVEAQVNSLRERLTRELEWRLRQRQLRHRLGCCLIKFSGVFFLLSLFVALIFGQVSF